MIPEQGLEDALGLGTAFRPECPELPIPAAAPLLVFRKPVAAQEDSGGGWGGCEAHPAGTSFAS